MVRPRPKYNGQGRTGIWPESLADASDFSSQVVEALRCFYPQKYTGATEGFTDAATNFAQALLVEARWAKSELAHSESEIDRETIRVVRDDLQGKLETLQNDLQSLPLEFDRLIGTTAIPLGVAEEIGKLLKDIKANASDDVINALPRKKTPRAIQRIVAQELTIRILPILHRYGVSTSATASADYDQASDAVKILQLLGKAVNICLNARTWRNIIADAKRKKTT